MVEKEEQIKELSRRNAEIFNLVIKSQNSKIEDLQTKIDGLVKTLSSLNERMNQQQQRINLLVISKMGNGPTNI